MLIVRPPAPSFPSKRQFGFQGRRDCCDHHASAYREAKSDRRVARRETALFGVLKIPSARIIAGARMRGIWRPVSIGCRPNLFGGFGSAAGTILTSFYLVLYLEVNQILMLMLGVSGVIGVIAWLQPVAVDV